MGLLWPDRGFSGLARDSCGQIKSPFGLKRVDQLEVLVGLEREGVLADHPWRPFESIVTALRPDIGPNCALEGGHCRMTRGTCCQSSGPAEVIVA